MLSTGESEWARMMVETMKREGYTYYVVREVYSNDSCDMELYVSREPILFSSSTVFTVNDGLVFSVDSSPTRYSSSYSGTAVTRSVCNSRVVVADYEFVYTNSQSDGIVMVPDIRETYGGVAHDESQTAIGSLLLVFCCFLLVSIGVKLFRS